MMYLSIISAFLYPALILISLRCVPSGLFAYCIIVCVGGGCCCCGGSFGGEGGSFGGEGGGVCFGVCSLT